MTDKTVPQLSYAGPTVDPLSLVPIAPKTAGTSTTDPTLNSYGDAESVFVKDLALSLGGHGAVGTTWWFTPPKNATNAGNFACFGIVVTPQAAMTVYSAAAFMTTVSGATYRIGIAPFDDTAHEMTSAPTYSTSASYSATGATDQTVVGNFPGGFAMTAGQTYVVFVNRTDAGDTPAQTIDNFDVRAIYPNLVVDGTSAQGRVSGKQIRPLRTHGRSAAAHTSSGSPTACRNV